MKEYSAKDNQEVKDVVLIGGGIMSATLGTFLKLLEPSWSIEIFERLEDVALESSDAWNNAGTGHSGLCELNYTPQKEDGTIDIKKAVGVAEKFEISKQFWSYLVKHKWISNPSDFINSNPHMSFVWGDENSDFLKKRYETMKENCLFENMIFSEDKKQLQKWIPLIMEGRKNGMKMAATRNELGTDVNFGSLTRKLITLLIEHKNVTLSLKHEVAHLHQHKDGLWEVDARNLKDRTHKKVLAKFVFIGAGGGALPLLEKSHINEGKGFGGFPVSGEWLRCTNKEVIEKHHAKVYGLASVGSPPMSVPHLDTRVINGEKALLFGPYAGFSTKFLKKGSFWDLPSSIQFDNIMSIIGAGIHNVALTEYLIKQVRQTPEDRFKALQEYVPEAKMEDWELVMAGQRVQIIKKDSDQGGILEFGTEVVHHDDKTIAALLGASPGASTSVSIILEVIQTCFDEKMKTKAWQKKLKEMIPTFGEKLSENKKLCHETRKHTHHVLRLKI
ncbi:malate:quinone oxidoreductase [Aureivirga sp. CE67]|uniref:malate:quinone oxidoreductase n=1 Tax=Aureivirga sp. CE67 TaxID=1788983 RepID=UPI0018CBDAA3|nr:malate:quinone oxidoreductase [Aureivirga sp. CE67]